jgi:hypothetical protein
MPFEKLDCPYCGEKCDAEWCDVGVGYVQMAPYHCMACHATEIGTYDTPRELTEKEKQTGWYEPGRPSEHVSTINGEVVQLDTAMDMYRNGIVDKVPFHLTLSEAEEAEMWAKAVRNRFRVSAPRNTGAPF